METAVDFEVDGVRIFELRGMEEREGIDLISNSIAGKRMERQWKIPSCYSLRLRDSSIRKHSQTYSTGGMSAIFEIDPLISVCIGYKHVH